MFEVDVKNVTERREEGKKGRGPAWVWVLIGLVILW